MNSGKWKQKMLRAALVATTLIVAGCGNDHPRMALIEINNPELSSLIDHSRPIEAYYLSNSTAKMAVQLVVFKDQITSYQSNNHTNYEQHVDFPEIGSAGGVRNALLRSALEEIDTMRSNIDQRWEQYLDIELAPLRQELAAANQVLVQATELRDSYLEYTHEHQSALDGIEDKIAINQQRFRKLQQLVMEDWDQYILNKELPIRRLNGNTQSIYTYESSHGQCHNNQGIRVDRLETDNLCYYLRVPYRELQDPEASQLYLDNFPEVLQLHRELGAPHNPVKGSLRAQLIEARAKLRDTLIKAENQFGHKMQIDQAFSRATNNVARIQARIEERSKPRVKIQFVDRLEREANQKMKELMESYVLALSSEIFSAIDRYEVPLTSPFELKADASVLLVSIPIASVWRGDGHALIFVNLNTPHDGTLIITPSQINSSIIPRGYYHKGIVEALGEFILDDIVKGNGALTKGLAK